MAEPDRYTRIQDTDHDGLDDRLAPAGQEPRDIQHILKRLERLKLGALPAKTLRRMERDLREEQVALLQRAHSLESEIHHSLVRGEVRVLETRRRQIRHLKRKHDGLEVDWRRVYDGLQRRLLRDNLIIRLGNERRVIWLESIVMVLIVFILGLLYYEFTYVDPKNTGVVYLIYLIDVGVCTIFLTELYLLHQSAEDKRWFWRRHWIAFISSIPFFPGPAQLGRFARLARLARLLRLLRVVRFFRVFRVVPFFWKGMDKLDNVMNVNLMKRAVQMVFVILILGGFTIFLLEGNFKDTELINVPDTIIEGIWWSFTTVVTGGFADIYNPQTPGGQLVTVILVLAGLVLVGVFTATLTSLYVRDNSEEMALLQEQLEEKIDLVAKDVETLTTKLKERR